MRAISVRLESMGLVYGVLVPASSRGIKKGDQVGGEGLVAMGGYLSIEQWRCQPFGESGLRICDFAVLRFLTVTLFGGALRLASLGTGIEQGKGPSSLFLIRTK